jgi:hypothetical protein
LEKFVGFSRIGKIAVDLVHRAFETRQTTMGGKAMAYLDIPLNKAEDF